MAGVLGVSLRKRRVVSANWSTGGSWIHVPTINSGRSEGWAAEQGSHLGTASVGSGSFRVWEPLFCLSAVVASWGKGGFI